MCSFDQGSSQKCILQLLTIYLKIRESSGKVCFMYTAQYVYRILIFESVEVKKYLWRISFLIINNQIACYYFVGICIYKSAEFVCMRYCSHWYDVAVVRTKWTFTKYEGLNLPAPEVHFLNVMLYASSHFIWQLDSSLHSSNKIMFLLWYFRFLIHVYCRVSYICTAMYTECIITRGNLSIQDSVTGAGVGVLWDVVANVFKFMYFQIKVN